MECFTKIWNRKFIFLFITNLFMLAAFFASIPLITVYCQELGITGTKTGIVLTALSVTAILFRPIAGYLLDNFNRYKVYFVFLLLFCLSFPAFLIFSFLCRIGDDKIIYGRGLLCVRLCNYDSGQRFAATEYDHSGN